MHDHAIVGETWNILGESGVKNSVYRKLVAYHLDTIRFNSVVWVDRSILGKLLVWKKNKIANGWNSVVEWRWQINYETQTKVMRRWVFFSGMTFKSHQINRFVYVIFVTSDGSCCLKLVTDISQKIWALLKFIHVQYLKQVFNCLHLIKSNLTKLKFNIFK